MPLARLAILTLNAVTRLPVVVSLILARFPNFSFARLDSLYFFGFRADDSLFETGRYTS